MTNFPKISEKTFFLLKNLSKLMKKNEYSMKIRRRKLEMMRKDESKRRKFHFLIRRKFELPKNLRNIYFSIVSKLRRLYKSMRFTENYSEIDGFRLRKEYKRMKEEVYSQLLLRNRIDLNEESSFIPIKEKTWIENMDIEKY